jgi:hypothetical protein
MISCGLYIASLQRVDLDLELIRHALTQAPQTIELKESFIKERTKRYVEGYEKFIDQKEDKDSLDEISKQIVRRSYPDWLKRNFNSLFEFSEARLNQLELIIRYALFETFIVKAVANILWDNADILKDPKHLKNLQLKSEVDFDNQHERIKTTKRAVRKIDHLDYDELCDYLKIFLKLDFGQHQYAEQLENIESARNWLSHKRQDIVLGIDFMTNAKRLLSGFPVLFMQAASKRYPNSCTMNPPEEEDDGSPGYKSLELFEEF